MFPLEGVGGREREREGEGERERESESESVCVCVCVCVRWRTFTRERCLCSLLGQGLGKRVWMAGSKSMVLKQFKPNNEGQRSPHDDLRSVSQAWT